jgi:hypothetical protein
MKHSRLNQRESSLFVCSNCREWGMKHLGRGKITGLHVGIAVPQPVIEHVLLPTAIDPIDAYELELI